MRRQRRQKGMRMVSTWWVAGVTGVALVGIVSAQEASRTASGWPGLWGPSRNAIASALPSPPRSAKNLWHRPSQGGYSELAIAGQRVITMDLRDGVDYVVALDADTGKDVWATRVGPTYRGHDSSEDGPIATPTIDGVNVEPSPAACERHSCHPW